MGWQVLCLFAFLTVNGLCSDYARLQKKHLWIWNLLRLYSLSHNTLMLLGLPLLLYDLLLRDSLVRSQVQSQLIEIINKIFGLVQVFLILACIYCARRLQSPIRSLFEQLQQLEGSQQVHAAKQHLRLLLRLKVSLQVLQVVIQFSAWLSLLRDSSIFELLGNSWRTCSISMIHATYFLLFVLLWRMCVCNVTLQAQLEQLLATSPCHSSRLQQLCQLQRQQQCLIRIVAQFCHHFRHVLLWYLLYVGFTGIQCGYYLIRIQFGRTHRILNQRVGILIGTIVLQALTELYLLCNLAGCMEQLGEASRRILWHSMSRRSSRRRRRRSRQAEQLERCVSARKD